MIAIPVWLEMLLGAVLGLCGCGLALRARPGPKRPLVLICGAILILLGAYLFLSNFL